MKQLTIGLPSTALAMPAHDTQAGNSTPLVQPAEPHPAFGEMEAISNLIRTPLNEGGWLVAEIRMDHPNFAALTRLFAASPKLLHAVIELERFTEDADLKALAQAAIDAATSH